MVGLPYPNMRSPELKEKMDYLNATLVSSGFIMKMIKKKSCTCRFAFQEFYFGGYVPLKSPYSDYNYGIMRLGQHQCKYRQI